jgi:hypothetical protein
VKGEKDVQLSSFTLNIRYLETGIPGRGEYIRLAFEYAEQLRESTLTLSFGSDSRLEMKHEQGSSGYVMIGAGLATF